MESSNEKIIYYLTVEDLQTVANDGLNRNLTETEIKMLLLQTFDNQLVLFDLKTAKPNAGNFKEFKRTLLEWVAAILCEDATVEVNTLIAIPYNPYDPKPYSRWTMRGMLDLDHELKVGNEFWDFLGGEGTFQDLLNCFERVGLELRTEIDDYFAKFGKK
jgi:Type II restriction endonuclease, TdeIII